RRSGPQREFPTASVCSLLALSRTGGRIVRLLRLRLVDVAYPRRAPEKGDAFRVSWLARSLDMGDYVVGDGFDIFRPQERSAFRRQLCPRILPVPAVAFPPT